MHTYNMSITNEQETAPCVMKRTNDRSRRKKDEKKKKKKKEKFGSKEHTIF